MRLHAWLLEATSKWVLHFKHSRSIMPRAIMIYPLIGGLAGYAGARVFGIEDGLAVFGIAVIATIVAGVGGFFYSRRSSR